MEKIVKLMKRKSPLTHQPHSHSPRSAKQILKRILCKHLTQAKKNWGYNCSFSNMSTFEAETSFQLKQ